MSQMWIKWQFVVVASKLLAFGHCGVSVNNGQPVFMLRLLSNPLMYASLSSVYTAPDAVLVQVLVEVALLQS